ncbi:MAG: tryptophan 2,3-dioxygenase [Crocinitomicaceae bacterium]|nr:tryptophan 2,3-dioxygenase [Crocinitomicaceae bacterium]|tara:strand:- start:56196 stop:57161 length:966 start_codon:yes stop_codon:yes gene_type:complete
MTREELLKEIDKKYEAMGQDPDVHLSGLLYSEPTKYWDYIQVEALLSLQCQKTTLKDEMVFIIYHQINELLFKMILWEIEQISEDESISTEKFTKHLNRISRYFDMLSNSFTIMGDGMDVDQYMKFRDTLTPASGFQSAQYRKIEFASTELINLIDFRFRKTINRDTEYSYAFDNLYWQVAGLDHNTGEKTKLIKNFEEKYKSEFLDFMKKYNTTNLWSKFKNLPQKERDNVNLVNAMRHYDHTVNISWVMHHLNAARKYLNSGKKSVEATGGSEWQKYMHPKYQRRIFFPELWSPSELKDWGNENVISEKILSDINDIKI